MLDQMIPGPAGADIAVIHASCTCETLAKDTWMAAIWLLPATDLRPPCSIPQRLPDAYGVISPMYRNLYRAAQLSAFLIDGLELVMQGLDR